MREIIARCPYCGKKGYTFHCIIDGNDFGWDAGCPSYKIYDGIHNVTKDTPWEMIPRVTGMGSRNVAITEWRKKAERIKGVENERQNDNGIRSQKTDEKTDKTQCEVYS